MRSWLHSCVEKENVLIEEVPQVANVGWVVNDWDPEYREYMGPLNELWAR
jgi:hypothetical protein